MHIYELSGKDLAFNAAHGSRGSKDMESAPAGQVQADPLGTLHPTGPIAKA